MTDTDTDITTSPDATPSGWRLLDRTLGGLLMALLWVTFPLAVYLSYVLMVWNGATCTDCSGGYYVVGAVAVVLYGAVMIGSSRAFARAMRADRLVVVPPLGGFLGLFMVFMLVALL